jgi:uncharacterized membrane protein YhhN
LARWVLFAAIAAGVSYMATWRLPLPFALETAWKGAGVGLLAVFAATRARSLDGWLLAAVMALGAAGDVLLETSGLVIGAAAFLAGHLTAVALYLRNRRSPLSAPDWIVGLGLAPAVAALAFALPADRAGAPTAAIYALGLGAMAASAWVSRFPRRLTGLGALMFVVSDLLIFYRTGRPIAREPWLGFAVWGLYFAGQTLIVLGVTRGLNSQIRSFPRKRGAFAG